ncbi:MAG: hypothetical protein HY356_04250 [Gammaproteobacteria bacterium]|nr:hypothetical protein [Gammaproteobacteria bacterium]
MDTTQMISVLLSWTVYLSGYPLPETLPVIEYQPHIFFVEKACLGNKNCRVAGWYDDNGTIYLDERVKGQEDAMTRSLIVHELVHYLQDLSGKYNHKNCEDYQAREREAYSIQRRYINRIAQQFSAIYVNFPPCPYS